MVDAARYPDDGESCRRHGIPRELTDMPLPGERRRWPLLVALVTHHGQAGDTRAGSTQILNFP